MSGDAGATRQAGRFDEPLACLTPVEARTIEAAMERIFPADELGPGATDARAVVYLDRALAGAEQHHQLLYRAAATWLDALATARFGAAFRHCGPDEQDAILADIQDGVAPETNASPNGPVFFGVLRAHTLEGLFADPVHGGNRDLVGWKLLGYPGAQPSYSHAEQQIDAVIVRDRIYTAADYPLPETEMPR